jgi:TolB-like protein/tetratricopeptide (TPR) repeat protein/tRNA A-37 threonylcarbamoyl transferase component Bud32
MPDSLTALQAALAERYAVQHELGRGGTGTVYLADDLKHQRRVAIKVLEPDLAAMVGGERFLREITLTARLDHPHILPLLDSGEASGFLYYVMPYVEGETLRDRLSREKQLPLDDALAITREVADALGHAHSRGIVHRDIKPENILLAGGHARVADFGIARAVTEAGGEKLTATGLAVGTPAYMSPEQAAGEQDLNGRSDLYSLGCVLYEMLAGEPPHVGASAQAIFAKRLSEPAPRVSVLRETVPGTVESALTRALARTPADRFNTAGQFTQALISVAEDGVVLRTRPVEQRRLVLAAAILMTLAGLSIGLLVVKPIGEPSRAIRSLVVLPLDNFAAGPEQEYFVEGMHDALTGELAQISALRVISRTSALQYKGSGKSVPEIANELNVNAVIAGSVFRAGDSVRIQVQLIGARPERHLWAQSFEGHLRDALSLMAQVSRSIADVVDAQLAPSEVERLADRPVVDPQAYDAWLRASFHASRRTGPDTDACIRSGNQAIGIDPSYAPAYQILADCYNLLTFVSATSPRETFPRAKEAASRALALDDKLAPAHASMASALAHYDWDWAGAEQSYRRALELNSALDRAHGDLGWLLAWLGRFDKALIHVRTAERLNPLSVPAALRVAMVLNLARRHDDAIATSLRAIEMDPTFMFAYDRLHWGYHGKGMYGEGVRAAERAVQLAGPDDVRRMAFLGHAYGLVGRLAESRVILDELLAREKNAYIPASAIAAAYLGLGEPERALDWIERGYEQRDGDLVLLKTFSLWDPLRGNPRFERIVRRMGFPQ